MTPAPQKEYIITEEQVQMVSKLGEFSNNFFKFVPPMVEKICSRPYESSDAVLDDIENSIHKLPPATSTKDILLWEVVFDGLKKLRSQTKERERMRKEMTR